MKKIDQDAARAFAMGENFSRSNTQVHVYPGYTEMTLHGNKIAERIPGKDYISLSNAGWQTSTTKSRLNAILAQYGKVRIYQTKFEWFIDLPSKKTTEIFPVNEFYEVNIA